MKANDKSRRRDAGSEGITSSVPYRWYTNTNMAGRAEIPPWICSNASLRTKTSRDGCSSGTRMASQAECLPDHVVWHSALWLQAVSLAWRVDQSVAEALFEGIL